MSALVVLVLLVIVGLVAAGFVLAHFGLVVLVGLGLVLVGRHLRRTGV
jgi:hypothetical protein